ncbi:MAG: peptide chain release factor N(5)-glutamine methyltransferase [Pyrinomonadaceae bacterium]
MKTYAELLNYASNELHQSGVEYARKEANSLLAFVLNRNRAYIIAHSNDFSTEGEAQEFLKLVARRKKREPIQHIKGFQEFWNREFIVSKDVLIPRPETEMLVEEALALLPKSEEASFCEVGIGSGAIAVSVLAERENLRAVAVDISDAALEVARINGERFEVESRLKLINSDVFENVPRQEFLLVVSNPPYIAVAELGSLETEVRMYDPKMALTDGADGLSIIERIARDAQEFLLPGGSLLMEIGINQADEVEKLIMANNWERCEFLKDLQGIQRVVKAKKHL